MALSNKQRAFVEHYLKCWNASEAARRAGYVGNVDVSGPRLLVNAGISIAIKARLSELHMSANEALSRIAAHGRGNIAPFLNANADGFDLTTDRAQAALDNIKKFKVKKRITTKDDFRTEEIESEIELYDALAAETLIGRHHALFTDKVKQESWEDDVIAALRDGKVQPADVVKELGSDIATRIIVAAGLRPDEGGEAAGGTDQPASNSLDTEPRAADAGPTV